MDVQLRDLVLDDIDSLAHIMITANESAFRGLVPDECLTFTEAESAANWHTFLEGEGLSESDFMVIAESADGEAIGYIWGGVKDDGDGIVRHLHLLPEYHKRGIGRQLVSCVAERLAGRGIYRMTVNVLRINPNRAFYERLGARWLSDHPYDWDGVTFTECVYLWTDTRSLLDYPTSP